MKRGDPLAYAAILVLASIWGYNWVVIKVATHDADAFSVSAIRTAVGAACLFGALIATRRSLRPPPFWPTLTLGLMQTTIYTVLQVLAIATGGAGKTAILFYTMPFWIVIIAWPVLHERISRSGAIALVLAAAGLALVATPLDLTHGLISKALAVVGAVIWAASSVYAKLVNSKDGTDLLALTMWQMFLGSLPLIAVATLNPNRHVAFTPAFLLAIGYIALLGTGLAWLLWMFLLARLPAGIVGVASLLTPVVGVCAAWLQLGERPGSLELCGMVCIVAALFLNLTPSRTAALRTTPLPD
ncbi:MAG: DMT family transporter [Candidatus Velthaea sp.]